MSSKGYLYVLYHPSFVSYHTPDYPEVYKLGLTIDPQARLKGYTTAFLGKATFKYISDVFINVKKAEKLLFYLLQSQRLADNREFFGVTLERATNLIQRLHSLSQEAFDRMYTLICNSMIPSHLRQQMKQDAIIDYVTELPSIEFIHNIPYDTFLETYRFRPRKPEQYPGYLPPETQLFLTLIKDNVDDDNNDDDNE